MLPKEYLTDAAASLLNEDMLTIRSFLTLKNAIVTYFENWVILKHDTHVFKIQSRISSHPLDSIIDATEFNKLFYSYSKDNWAIRYSLDILYNTLYRYFETRGIHKVGD